MENYKITDVNKSFKDKKLNVSVDITLWRSDDVDKLRDILAVIKELPQDQQETLFDHFNSVNGSNDFAELMTSIPNRLYNHIFIWEMCKLLPFNMSKYIRNIKNLDCLDDKKFISSIELLASIKLNEIRESAKSKNNNFIITKSRLLAFKNEVEAAFDSLKLRREEEKEAQQKAKEEKQLDEIIQGFHIN